MGHTFCNKMKGVREVELGSGRKLNYEDFEVEGLGNFILYCPELKQRTQDSVP